MGRRATGTVRSAYGRIQVGYTPAPGERRQWFTVPGLRPTKANLDAVRRDLPQYIHRHQHGHGDTFAACAQAYLDAADLKLSTRNAYRDSLNLYWLSVLGDKGVLSITFPQLLDLDRGISWSSAKTRRNALCALRGVFRYAYPLHQRNWRESPAHGLDLGDPGTPPDPDPYTREERKRIVDKGTMYEWLAFGTGMRTGEIIALTWSAYDGDKFRVTTARVRTQLKGTKTDRPRNVVVPAWLRDKLETHPTRAIGETVLLNQYNRPYLSGYHLNKKHRALLAGLGIQQKEGPYPWRHTYASLSLMDGASPEFVSQQLGHSVATLRRNYAKWISGEYDESEMSKMRW